MAYRPRYIVSGRGHQKRDNQLFKWQTFDSDPARFQRPADYRSIVKAGNAIATQRNLRLCMHFM